MPSGRFYDPKSGAVVPIANMLANPSAYFWMDQRHGAIIPATTYLANPGAYGYYDPDNGLAPQPAQAVNLANLGVTDWTPLVGFNRYAPGIYAPNKEAVDFKNDLLNNTSVQVYYWDTSRPDNAGNGLTPATAKRDLSAAWALAPGGAQTNRIRAILDATRIAWGTRGSTTSASTTKNIIVEADDGGEIIIAGGALTGPLTYTPMGDGTYLASSGVSSGSAPSAPVDYSPAARAATVYGQGYTYAQTTGATAANDPSIGAALQPGQSYKQLSTGTNDFRVRPLFDAPLADWAAYLVPGSTASNQLLMKAEDTTDANIKFFLQRVTVNGGIPIIFQNRRTTPGGEPVLVLDRCAALASAPTANGIAYGAACQAITYDCIIDRAAADALNPHSVVAGQPTWTSGQCKTIDIRPKLGTIGFDLSGNANLITGHEDTRGIVSMAQGGIDVGGRPAHYIDQSKVLVLGGAIGPSTRVSDSANQTAFAASTAQISLAEVAVATSPGTIDIQADVGAAVNCYGMTQGALRTSGPVTFNPLPA